MSDSARRSTWAPYRSVTLTPPEEITDDDLIEVTLQWGEQVLSVTHLHRGERFEHELTHEGSRSTFEVTRRSVCEITVPEGASAWVVRDGRCEEQRSTFALSRDATACVDLGGLTLRVRRVAPPEAVVRSRRVTPFAAATALALALTTTGFAWAASLDEGDDAPIASVRDDPHPWILAHANAHTYEAPSLPSGREGLMVGRSNVIIVPMAGCCFCFLPRQCRADFDAPEEDCVPFDGDRFVGLMDVTSLLESRVSVGQVRGRDAMRASEIRYGVTENLAEIAACNSAPWWAVGSVTLRMVVSASGAVIAAGVTRSTHPSSEFASCVERKAKTWRFAPSQSGERVTVEAPIVLR